MSFKVNWLPIFPSHQRLPCTAYQKRLHCLFWCLCMCSTVDVCFHVSSCFWSINPKTPDWIVLKAGLALTVQIQTLCVVLSPPNSLSRASTMPRSTWVELVMRQSLLPRRRWFWGCLCETLHCRCHWIRRCTRMGLPIRGLRLLTYTKEGKKVTDSSALMYWENWPYINDLDVSIIVLYHCICFFSLFFFKSWRQVAQKSLFWCDHLVRCYLPNRNRDMHRHMLQFG